MSQHSSTGAAWEALRKKVLQRDPICTYCHDRQSTEVDHILAKSRGGKDSLDNCVGTCKPCNSRKQDKQVTRTTWLNPRYFPAT